MSHVMVLPRPPPTMPSAGSPNRPKINAQLIKPLIPIPAALSTNTARGRSSAETKFRIRVNRSHGAVHHM